MPKLHYLTCPECGKPAIDGQTHPLCKKRYGLDGLMSLYPYSGIVQRAIKQIKYRFAFRVINDLLDSANIDRIISWKQRMEKNNKLVIPIPLHVSRYNFRGFNQSEIVARYIAKRLSVPTEKNLLVRIRKTQSQVDMKSRWERLHNMKNVFAVLKTDSVVSKTGVLLIDDVYTTGATMRSAALILKQEGIEAVWGLTIAQ